MMMKERYESLPLNELRQVAKARGLKGISALRKDQLVARMLEEDAKDQEKKAAEHTAEGKADKAERAERTERVDGRSVPNGRSVSRERSALRGAAAWRRRNRTEKRCVL